MPEIGGIDFGRQQENRGRARCGHVVIELGHDGGARALDQVQRQQPFRAAPGREGEHQLFEEGWNLVEQIEQAGYVRDRLFFRLDADGAVKRDIVRSMPLVTKDSTAARAVSNISLTNGSSSRPKSCSTNPAASMRPGGRPIPRRRRGNSWPRC